MCLMFYYQHTLWLFFGSYFYHHKINTNTNTLKLFIVENKKLNMLYNKLHLPRFIECSVSAPQDLLFRDY